VTRRATITLVLYCDLHTREKTRINLLGKMMFKAVIVALGALVMGVRAEAAVE